MNTTNALVEGVNNHAVHNKTSLFEDSINSKLLSTFDQIPLLKDLELGRLSTNLSKIKSFDQIDTERNFLDVLHPSQLGAHKIGARLGEYLIADLNQKKE